jgi:hypothetical protein
MSCASSLSLLERVCALKGEGNGLACPGSVLLGTVGVAAAELSGGAGGDTQWGAPGDADGPDVAVAANRAQTSNRAGAAML